MTFDSAIALSGVFKTYGGRQIFKALNLVVPRGQFAVLLGRNGTGKSTLLRLIAGLEPADAGEIYTLNTNVEIESVVRRQKIAFVSELISVDPGAALKKIVNTYSPLQPKWDSSIFEKFVYAFNLSLDKNFGSLSRGQKVQLFFAMAAAGKPDIFLLDEVTSVLDANARFEVMNHLRAEVENGASVLLATNIAAETHNFAKEIVFLVDGAIGLNCSVDDLQNRFSKIRISPESAPSFQIPKSAHPVQLNRDGSISYLIPSEDLRTGDVPLMDQRGITIEDVFIYFTGPERK